MSIVKSRWVYGVLVVGSVAGCSGRDGGATQVREGTATSRQALQAFNGLGENGLTTNGLWANGLWANGLWANGLWANGLWANGLWANGLWANGLWANGLWANGLWANGLWANGLWANGLWANGLPGSPGYSIKNPGYLLQQSPNLRQLLRYVYECAMPPGYDTTIDPNRTLDPSSPGLPCNPPPPCDAGAESGGDGGTTCSTVGTCDVGYICATEATPNAKPGTCVVPLNGLIGLAVNKDGSHWWDPPVTASTGEAGAGDAGASEAGTCDETCQRWVSACVLARTNAYGVHVRISLRAPADAPQGIKDALATTPDEVANYTLREGAYYGNIFGTTPVNPAPSPTYSGPAIGPIAETPSFYACAGPASNIPEITKRFCSSQGDQAVIHVPGMCLPLAANPEAGIGVPAPGTCLGEDTDSASPTFGSIQDCYTLAGTTTEDAGATSHNGSPYAEVLTVYLQEPIAVCGNGVCEDTENSANCPSDCHPGTWAKNYTTPFTLITDYSARVGMSAVAPDDSIVVAGYSTHDLDLGGGTLPFSQGPGVLAKYHSDGSYAWGARFGNTSEFATGGILQWALGPVVTSNGNITVIGQGAEGYVNPNVRAFWISTFTADGALIGNLSVPVCPGTCDIDPFWSFAVDSQGNILVTGWYEGTVTLGSTTLSSVDPRGGTNAEFHLGDVFLTKISPQGSVLWALSFGGSGDNIPCALTVDSADNILLTTLFADNLSAGFNPSALQKLAPDGSILWSVPPASSAAPPSALFETAAADPNGNVYASGYFASGEDFGGGPVSSGTGLMPFLAKYGPDGSFQWVSHPTTTCPSNYPDCGEPPAVAERDQVNLMGSQIGFDRAGNPVLASWGKSAARGYGGGTNFGVGTFPTYFARNIFVSAYSSTNGKLYWAKQVPTVLDGVSSGLGVDSQGRVIVSGQYAGSMQVDGQLLVTPVPDDRLVGSTFLASFAAPSPLDTTPPVIGAVTDQLGALVDTVPNNMVVEATSAAGADVFYMPPTVIDTGGVSSGTPPGTSVYCSPAPNTTFSLGVTIVTCTASDSLGNESSASFSVAVIDTQPPLFSPIANVTVEATSAAGANLTYPAPTATDQVDGSRPVSCSPASGSVFPLGLTTVTCTASDKAGNTSSTTFSVTVADTTPPALTLPEAITATATSTGGAVVTYVASATDNVDGPFTPACSPPSGSTFPLGTTTVNCAATDAHGNTAAGTFQAQVHYAWSGFLPPIQSDGSSIFNLGRTVPVKFQLTGASAGITNAVATLSVAQMSSNVTGTTLEAASTYAATTGNAFRYDPTTQQYIFNLATQPLSTGSWALSVNLQDGVSRTVTISLR
jgi:hypothetical protein